MNYKMLGIIGGFLLMAPPILRRNQMLLSIRGVIETVHYLPGRIRLMIPSLKGNAEAAKILKNQLIRLDQVASVQTSPISGSVIIQFDSSAITPEILFGATARILGLDKLIETANKPLLWQEMKSAGKAVDYAILNNSGGFLDLKTLVTLVLLGTLTYKAVTQPHRPAIPGTITLGWWVFNLLFMRGAV